MGNRVGKQFDCIQPNESAPSTPRSSPLTKTSHSTMAQLPLTISSPFKWQWQENNGTWHDYDEDSSTQLNDTHVKLSMKCSANENNYTITKLTETTASQVNTSTNVTRKARRVGNFSCVKTTGPFSPSARPPFFLPRPSLHSPTHSVHPGLSHPHLTPSPSPSVSTPTPAKQTHGVTRALSLTEKQKKTLQLSNG